MTETTRNRAAFAFVGLLTAAALGFGYIVRAKDGGDPGHLVGGYYASPDAAPTDCFYVTVRGPSEIWNRLGLSAVDGGSGIALAKTCFTVPPECVTTPDAAQCAVEAIPLPSGIEYLPEDSWARPYIPGEPVFEVWTAEHSGAMWRCACGGPGADTDAGVCEQLAPVWVEEDGLLPGPTVEAPGVPGKIRRQLDGGVWTPVTPLEEHRGFAQGEWRGNCRRIPCASWAGMQVLPAECRAHGCDGLECGMGRAGELCGSVKGYQTKDERGNDLTCVANKWARECDDNVRCGVPGRWYVKQCPCAADAGQ